MVEIRSRQTFRGLYLARFDRRTYVRYPEQVKYEEGSDLDGKCYGWKARTQGTKERTIRLS